MTMPPVPGEEDPLQAADGDPRIVSLAKKAAASLLAAGRPVTRATLVAEAKSLDTHKKGRWRGLCEASIDANPQVRTIYEASRTWKAPRRYHRSGKIDPQIRRLTKEETVTALLLARLATQERVIEFDLARNRYTGTIDLLAIEQARAECSILRANRPAPSQPPGLERASKKKKEGSIRRVKTALRDDGARSDSAIARSAGVHVATVERIRKEAVRRRKDEELGIDHEQRRRLMRLSKRDLHRALHTERTLIRAIDAQTMHIAVGIVAHDRQRIRVEARGLR